jgi:hypothetical protein
MRWILFVVALPTALASWLVIALLGLGFARRYRWAPGLILTACWRDARCGWRLRRLALMAARSRGLVLRRSLAVRSQLDGRRPLRNRERLSRRGARAQRLRADRPTSRAREVVGRVARRGPRELVGVATAAMAGGSPRRYRRDAYPIVSESSPFEKTSIGTVDGPT